MTDPAPQPEGPEATQPVATDADASAETEAASDGTELSAEDASGDEEPKKKRKRRRRRKKKKPEGVEATDGAAPTPAVDDVAASMANLAGGLLSHVDDREIPCRVEGCKNTWIWTSDEQIRNFGQPPPRRMCREHSSQLDSSSDTQVPCSNPGCEKTWTWTKSARVQQIQRGGSAIPPRRMCPDCEREEKELPDREVRCKVDGCKRSWTWTRDAQLKHRTWLRRTGGEAEVAPPQGKGKRRRRRRGRAAGVNDPPPRMCEPCRAKAARLVEREGPCKVHGCTRMAKVDRDSQLRAWAQLETEDLDAEAPLPRRMCDVCREFCRHHPDREVVCGRPGCDNTWTFKTGAQLQAFLAGRLEDPMRLCSECSKGDFVMLPRPAEAPPGAEVMPCVVGGCEGVWYWLPGTAIAPANPGDLPTDRMCAEHRKEHQPGTSNKPTDESKDAPAPEPPSESTEASTATTTEVSTETASPEAVTEPERAIEASAESPAE